MSKHLISQPKQPIATLVLAHGAGAGCESEFMRDMAQRLTELGIRVVRFNFAYMDVIEQTGKRRPPPKMDVLIAEFAAHLAALDFDQPLFIGGKSMGGRVASLLIERSTALGCLCLGYPFHPPNKPDKVRTAHLYQAIKPVLVVQGERDTFGSREEAMAYGLPDAVALSFLNDGDHSFKPRVRSGASLEQNLSAAAEHIYRFVCQHSKRA